MKMGGGGEKKEERKNGNSAVGSRRDDEWTNYWVEPDGSFSLFMSYVVCVKGGGAASDQRKLGVGIIGLLYEFHLENDLPLNKWDRMGIWVPFAIQHHND